MCSGPCWVSPVPGSDLSLSCIPYPFRWPKEWVPCFYMLSIIVDSVIKVRSLVDPPHPFVFFLPFRSVFYKFVYFLFSVKGISEIQSMDVSTWLESTLDWILRSTWCWCLWWHSGFWPCRFSCEFLKHSTSLLQAKFFVWMYVISSLSYFNLQSGVDTLLE